LAAACSSSSSPSGDEQPGAPPANAPVNPGESQDSKDKPKDPVTRIHVGIDAEDFRSQGLIMSTVDVVATVDGVVAAMETLDAKNGPLFPHELVVAPPASDPEATIAVSVIAHDSSGATNDGAPPLVKRTAEAKFVKGKESLLFMFLEVRCNTDQLVGGGGPSGPVCTMPGQTCIGGTCQSDAVTSLPDYQADWATNPPSACGSGTPSLVVGQGETAYAPLADGDTVTLVEGPQCGHHVWLALDMQNLAQFGTTTTVSATQPGSSTTVAPTAFPYAYAQNGASCELPGVRFQLDIAGPIADFLGKPLDITVQAKDRAGKVSSATRHVNIPTTYTKGPRPCP
jgi:hypothetical protein